MLEAWIIEQLRKRELEERRRRQERSMELPLELPELPEPKPARRDGEEDEPRRGVVEIDYNVKGVWFPF